ncbi:branched-chain amino acid ABC transporter permease/ATP-binding protein [Nocardioides humi]|uniref:Branched-chain amino acid ABC transporter permease/ATP-binding protein n=1 Tax=Nocardioides humi TaxID=449461 RepID=A0ABN2ADM4_9ACTN|nr:branched-chain amino acid ABC transporter permease/ATP-binding protein [Nocardioides humi]
MSNFLVFLALGLGLGAVYSSLAVSIVVTYRGTGVVNFACAAMATLPVYVFNDLTANGQLSLPFLPSLALDPPLPVAVLISLTEGALIALLVHLVIFYPLRNAPELARVVASIGLFLAITQGISLRYGAEQRPLLPVLPESPELTVGGAILNTPRLWLAGLVVVLSLATSLWLARTRWGLAVRASAENERAAALAGISPAKVAFVSLLLATVSTTLVFVLAGPTIGLLTPTAPPMLIVPALAAALLGRLRSIGWTLLAGLAIGVASAQITYFSSVEPWWPTWARQGLGDALPFAIIVVALFLMGRRIPGRAAEVTVSLPSVVVPRNRLLVVVLTAGLGLVAVLGTEGVYRYGVVTTLASLLIMLSFVVLTGAVGQISLAQAAFAGAAGFALSKIGDALPFPISMIVAALAASALGVLLGLPALRIRGVQLAIVSLAAALAIQKFVFSNSAFTDPGGNFVPSPSLFGWEIAPQSGSVIATREFCLLVFAVVLVVTLLVGNVLRGETGRHFLAVRSNESAAAFAGIDVARTKIVAFAVSSFLAGLGGSLLSYTRGQLDGGSYGVVVGLTFLAVAYVGGITSIGGAVVASVLAPLGVLYVFIDRDLNGASWYPLAGGLLLIVTVLQNPSGIAGQFRRDLGRLSARLRGGRRVGPATATPPASAPAAPDPEPMLRREIGGTCFEARGVTVRYSGLVAVDAVDLEVRAGEIVGLIGPNGAGKTSFVDAITGFCKADGTISLGGREISRHGPTRRAHEGLARTWQNTELFGDLSVADNVRVATERGGLAGLARDAVRPTRPVKRSVTDALRLLALDDIADQPATALSLGRQKLVGVARALAMEPRMLCLDEPAAGLDSYETAEFAGTLRRIASSGVGCLLIDHDMGLVLDVCDRLYVLEFGEVIAVGRPDEVRRDPRVIQAYLGSAAASAVETSGLATEGQRR